MVAAVALALPQGAPRPAETLAVVAAAVGPEAQSLAAVAVAALPAEYWAALPQVALAVVVAAAVPEVHWPWPRPRAAVWAATRPG